MTAPITNLWYDVFRSPPEGWYWAKSYQSAITALTAGLVMNASLDYGMGYVNSHEGQQPTGVPDIPLDVTDHTGYDLLVWMNTNSKWPSRTIACHSSDTVNRLRMVNYVNTNGPYNASQPAKMACGGIFGSVEATLFVYHPPEWIVSKLKPL